MKVAGKSHAVRARCALTRMRRLRGKLAARSVSLSMILEDGETLRELAYSDCNGRSGRTVRESRDS